MDTLLVIIFVFLLKLLQFWLPVFFLLCLAIFAVSILIKIFKPLYAIVEIIFYTLSFLSRFVQSVFRTGIFRTIKSIRFEKTVISNTSQRKNTQKSNRSNKLRFFQVGQYMEEDDKRQGGGAWKL